RPADHRLNTGFSSSLVFVMTAIMTSFGFLRHFSLPQIRVSIYWWQYIGLLCLVAMDSPGLTFYYHVYPFVQ
ncbi:MAG TPA: hypothetical protein VFU89_06650, partial [Rhabdochlamydiaceae bacterium]|nr:hypothetical protein [Rhabdochlamydiaceae bacterium]